MDQQKSLDLGGEWQLVLDPDDEGLKCGWATGQYPIQKSKNVNVPGIWNLVYPEYEGVAFYRKTFEAPDDWVDQVSLIQFEGVSYKTEGWLNGHFLGSHEGAYTGFAFDISSWLQPGEENELILRVAGLSKTKPIDGILLKHAPASKQSWYFTHGGPWGRIWLERRPWVYIENLALEPDLRKEKVRLEAALSNMLPQVQEILLQIQIIDPNGIAVVEFSTSLIANPGTTRHSFELHIPRPLAWTCDTPYLYRVRVEAASHSGEGDVLEDRFGMRDFTVRDGEFLLNGKPVFIRGILLQPHYPVTHIVPHDPEMMRREIILMKEAGFNMIRCHIRPAPPGYLDITDELGMLVYAETSLAWIRESPRIREHGEREIRALIERDRNHPSVVVWGLLNENPPASAAYSDCFLSCARALDPTRVIVDNSGGSLAFDQDFGWIDRAYILANRETAKQKILDIHTYLGNYISHGVYEWLRDLGTGASSDALSANDFCSQEVLGEFQRESRAYRGKIFVSELGGGGMADLETNYSRYGGQVDLVDAREINAFKEGLINGFYQRKLDRIFGNVRGMSAAAQALQAGGDVRQVEAVISNPRLSGFVLTQVNDLSWEFHGGLLDTWRNPKLAYHALIRVNQPYCLVMKAQSPVVACGEPVDVSIGLVSRDARPPMGEVVVDISGPGEESCESHRWPVQPVWDVQDIATLTLKTGDTPGTYTVSARYEFDGQQLAGSIERILTLPYTNLADKLARISWRGKPGGLGDAEADLLRSYDGQGTSGQSDNPVNVAPYPSELSYREWAVLLEGCEEGNTVILGPLHRKDQRALEVLQSKGVNIRLEVGIGSWVGSYHWTPASPLFEGLPCAGFAGEAYIDVLPLYSLAEQGGEILAGALRSKHRVEADSDILWYSDIEIVPYGNGKILFCQYRLFDKLGAHPLARRLFNNLVGLLLN
jgi:beta-galactosidase